MFIQRIEFAVTTDASGNATVFSPFPVRGLVHQLRYVPSGSPLDTGADVTISGERSGLVVYNQANIGTSAFEKAPRQPTHDILGAASLYAGAGEPVEDKFAVADERLKLVVAQGGNALSGTFHLWVGG